MNWNSCCGGNKLKRQCRSCGIKNAVVLAMTVRTVRTVRVRKKQSPRVNRLHRRLDDQGRSSGKRNDKRLRLVHFKGEVCTIKDRNICERRSCMKNSDKSPTFKFVSGEERRPSEVQRVSRGWCLPGATHSSADLTWIRK